MNRASQNIKLTNILVKGAPKGEARKKKKIFEDIMGESFPNLTENFHLHFQEAQQTSVG